MVMWFKIWTDHARGHATNASKIPGDGAEGAGKTSSISGSDASDEEMRVNKKVRDELQEPEGVKEKAKQAVHAVGDKIKDTGKSIKDATDNETVEKVGDTVKGAGKTMKENSSDKQGLGKQDVVTS